VGVIVLGLIALAARALGGLAGVSGSRFQPMLEALLLLAVLTTGGNAIVPETIRAVRRFRPARRNRNGGTATAPPRRREHLRAEGLKRRFGPISAVEGVSLELRPGTVTALIGPNGSGKTTILRLLSGTLAPDQGSIRLGERELSGLPPAARVEAGLVRTLQSRAFFSDLTVLEHALVGVNRTRRYGGAIRTLVSTPLYRSENRLAEAHARAALETVRLAGEAERPAYELTGSDRHRLMIAAALATNPAVLLLDEPSAGATPEDLDRLAEIFSALKAGGLAVLLVEHNRALVRAVADEVIELELGRVAAREPELRL
jgi:ABC-type branched-subunit amino acid transport system ATPase component